MTVIAILEVAQMWLGSLRSWNSSTEPATLMPRSLRNIVLCCLQTHQARLLTRRMTKSMYRRRNGNDRRAPRHSGDRLCGRAGPVLVQAVDGLMHLGKG